MRDEPNMSDTTLLVSVEDLINMAMGPSDKNVVNFKLIQTVLHILARQLRMLDQRVEICISDDKERKSRSIEKKTLEKAAKKETEKTEKTAPKEKEKVEQAASKEKEKAERAVSKEREKAERAASKEREKTDKAAEKEKAKTDKAAEKADKAAEKADKAAEKEKEKADKAAEKEKQKAEKAAAKEQDKAERAASKDREKAEKAAEKGDKASKEQEKAEKAAAKEKEKEEKAAAKAEKEKEKAEKEQEKAAKAEAKEKEKAEKAEKAAAKELEKAEKMAAKEKEKAEKEVAMEKEKAEKELEKVKSIDKKGKAASDTSIVVSEVERRKEKVLIVEKGPTTRSDTRRESIEVVTKSQFNIVEAMVKELQQHAGPVPPPALPDNKKLMKDLVKGSASLTDTMQAMQVTARVSAAEKAISRMGEMLTALAAAGALPEEFRDVNLKFEPDVDAELALMEKARAGGARKSVAIDPMFGRLSTASIIGRPSVATATSRLSMALGRPSTISRASMSSALMTAVTHPEMDSAIRDLREDLTKTVQTMTSKATSIAENASASAKAVSEKLEIALKLNMRISTLHSLVSDYAEQLAGFDAGLTTQMSSFRDQMTQMRAELDAGLKLLEQVNNNAETAAVMELTERYEVLVTELDHAMNTHRALTSFQNQLGDELHSLVECVEMLREQKADRDEVLDGLRDKADNSRLAGLLTGVEFNLARIELEKRLEVCHDKFKRQENIWMMALKDLTCVTESKAEITQLLAAREAAELMLLELQEKQKRLAVILGEPKAAVLTRSLARGAMCGSCLAPALMEPQDKSYGAPPPLPAMRPHPIGAAAEDEEPCTPEWKPPEPPDTRDHICHRWVGGSHTLLSEAVTRERAPPLQLQDAPTKRYAGYGSDGRLYMLEEDLQPCVECNKLPEKLEDEPAPAPPADGAGDQGPPSLPT